MVGQAEGRMTDVTGHQSHQPRGDDSRLSAVESVRDTCDRQDDEGAENRRESGDRPPDNLLSRSTGEPLQSQATQGEAP